MPHLSTPPALHAPTAAADPRLSDRLRARLDALGVSVIGLGTDGRATALGRVGWGEGLVAGSAPFAAQVRRRWDEIAAAAGQAVAIWPELWLAPLPAPRRRRSPDEGAGPRLVAAVLVGHGFPAADEFRLICDTRGLDHQAASARIDPASRVSPVEARRLAASLAWMHEDETEVERRRGELTTLSEELGESYEELSLLYKLSTSMTVDQDPAVFLTEACRELQQVLGLRWMALQLSADEHRLGDLVGRVFTAGPIGGDAAALRRAGERLLRASPASPASLSGPEPVIVDDTRALGVPELPSLARQMLIVSLLRNGRPFGLLYGGDKLDGSQISSVDSKLCSSLANSLSIFLDNMILYEDMEAMFLGTLHALTASIDAKDSYTRGHSERVALLSKQLAAAAGLDPAVVVRVYLAGLIHDVGKIGVPEAVLCKPGRLNDEEFALIKMHPEIGARILQDIRQMGDLVPGVLHHHERWDGRGYPHGLRGESIPLLGRLICLADSFDAMSSNRTYRRALRHEEVLAEVRRCAGTQFDPRLAAAFVALDFTPFFDLIARHQRDIGVSPRPAAPPPTAGPAPAPALAPAPGGPR